MSRRPAIGGAMAVRLAPWGALLLALLPLRIVASPPGSPPSTSRFEISIDRAIAGNATVGRLFVFISRRFDAEPRLFDGSVYFNNAPSSPLTAPLIFARDVENVTGGPPLALDGSAVGYPLENLRQIPAGEYNVQAVLSVYTQFKRSDGRTLWAHKDDGEGQDVLAGPGNLVSAPVRVHLDPHRGFVVPLTLNRMLPARERPKDTELIKHLHFRSALASTFWGQDMEVGLTVALPSSYAEHPQRHYPVVLHQGHFGESAVFSALEPPLAEPGSAQMSAWSAAFGRFAADWGAGRTPQLIVVTLQHATPYYDTSYFMNSPNTGPWGDVLINEIIPYINAHLRAIPQPYARVLAGLSSGGGISAYLQVHYPEQFGGAWIFAPDPIDFHDFYTIDLYADENAYRAPGFAWNLAPPRCEFRSSRGQCLQTMEGLIRFFDVLGSHGRSGQWLDNYDAMYGPVGTDGYPVPVWDHRTGKIDHQVVGYWREHGADLRAYLQANQSRLAPDLTDKLHFAAGDMDNYFLNNGLYLLQDFLAEPEAPAIHATFKFGRPMIGHTFIGVGYDPFPAALLEDMAAQILKHTPPGQDTSWHSDSVH